MSQIKKIFLALVILVLIFPAGAGAQSTKFDFTFSIGDSSMGLPAGSIHDIIKNVVYWLLGIFAFFGIIGFVVSGIMYLVSAGNDEMITKAKKYMLYSIVGVVVGLMGYVILQAAKWMLGGSNTTF
ncbi:MAG: hypothetical protein CO140_03445 [Candidatus Moranbacteria bacterium CG_4_9_14_3_um_filter_40_7]|nr:MAG: hypothetical protein COX31_03565 [Candidatus Moranbacteria bacterium CG23_combo_of_CG06-09_8_20_14_all_40_16]PIU81043.1 MAG: hypothetical protein COS71_00200 [Candidatus Moranbacteria bacterium CG06_land_8_20_14_3_00_40_12]PJA87607.1 MAG: hypothetical protein CO140_03445 [Candidatus Moranbacteria bacterium CG_4_9_14_3_um_filter_40_7]